MAKKSISNEIKNELKREGRSAAKRTVKKGVKSVAKEAFGNDKKAKKLLPKRNIALKILPYFMIVFALLLAIFFITVHILSAEAGFIGDLVQYAFGGFFGGAAILFPLAMGYLGVRWCLYNVKWKEGSVDPDSEEFDDYKKAKRRIIMIGIMVFLVILTISSLLGVFSGADLSEGIDIGDWWEEGGESLILGGGGVIGGLIGGLLVAAIRDVSSIIVLIVLLIVFSLLMFGITPDYVVEKIQNLIERRKEALAARREEEAAQRVLPRRWQSARRRWC